MGGGHEETPRGWRADTGRDSHKAEAAGIINIAQGKGCAKRSGLYHVTPEGGEPLATFAATLDPATLAALGLAGARIWGALA
jgi:hypothetical protein